LAIHDKIDNQRKERPMQTTIEQKKVEFATQADPKELAK